MARSAPHGSPATAPPEGECRLCASCCDKVIDPAACVAIGCRFLYAYDDERSGQRYVGCLNKVFRAEVESGALERGRRSGRGFGGLRVSGQPLPHCPTGIERAFEGAGRGSRCVNPQFWACEPRPVADQRELR